MTGSTARFVVWGMFFAMISGAARAHTSLGEYVQHRYILTVTLKNIDLTVELTFNGEPAQTERTLMDTDKDGVISRDEQRGYIARWEKSSSDQVHVKCEPGAVPLAPLYAPDLDLQGERAVSRHPFIVRLKFFSRTPETIKAGDSMRIESSLQIQSPALVALEVNGDADPPITIEPGHGDTLPALKTGIRTFDVRCPKFKRSTNPVKQLHSLAGPESAAPTQTPTKSADSPSKSVGKSPTGDRHHD